MSYAGLLNQTGTIKRRAYLAKEASTGQPLYGEYATLSATVKYRIVDVDQNEIELDKRTHTSEHRLFLLAGEDVTTDDKFFDADSNEYDVISVQSITGFTSATHHKECRVRRVT